MERPPTASCTSLAVKLKSRKDSIELWKEGDRNLIVDRSLEKPYSTVIGHRKMCLNLVENNIDPKKAAKISLSTSKLLNHPFALLVLNMKINK